jgi:hypothetical protein
MLIAEEGRHALALAGEQQREAEKTPKVDARGRPRKIVPGDVDLSSCTGKEFIQRAREFSLPIEEL